MRFAQQPGREPGNSFFLCSFLEVSSSTASLLSVAFLPSALNPRQMVLARLPTTTLAPRALVRMQEPPVTPAPVT